MHFKMVFTTALRKNWTRQATLNCNPVSEGYIKNATCSFVQLSGKTESSLKDVCDEFRETLYTWN